MTLTETVQASLVKENVDRQRFARINCELLGRGTIYRGSSESHKKLYDDAHRIRELLTEYWEQCGFRLQHDEVTGYFQLFPPGAEVPGEQHDEEFEADAAVRRRVSNDLAALLIILRFLYDQKMTRGDVYGDEVPVTIEEIALTMKTNLKRDLPDGIADRERLLRDLRFREVIKYGEDAHIVGSDARIAILPPIMTIVGLDACRAIVEASTAVASSSPERPQQRRADEDQ